MEGGGGEEGVDLHQISISNEISGASFLLVPRWESCAPQPVSGRALVTFIKPTASLPASEDAKRRVASPLAEVNQLILSIQKRGERMGTIPLVQCKSRAEFSTLPLAKGNLYLNLEVYPEDGRASLRLYEFNRNSGQMTWLSTGFYFVGLISSGAEPEAEVPCADLGRYKCPELSGNKPLYFHGIGFDEISWPPLKINFKKDFTVEKRIGKGTEGTVSRCLSNFSSSYSAVKITDQGNLLVRTAHYEPREVTVLSMLSHCNIAVPYLAWTEENTSRYTSVVGCAFLSMKLYDRSLLQYLNERPEIDLESNKRIFRQILEALCVMHKNGIVHRDIKPANILIEPDLTVKIADFGIAKVMASAKDHSLGGIYGSLPYCAPELANLTTGHDEKVDIFSAGVVYCELFLPCRRESKETLRLLSRKIRARAQELSYDLLGRKFDLDVALDGTTILENWTGNLATLKQMISPRGNERLSAMELLEFFDKEDPADNRDEAVVN